MVCTGAHRLIGTGFRHRRFICACALAERALELDNWWIVIGSGNLYPSIVRSRRATGSFRLVMDPGQAPRLFACIVGWRVRNCSLLDYQYPHEWWLLLHYCI